MPELPVGPRTRAEIMLLHLLQHPEVLRRLCARGQFTRRYLELVLLECCPHDAEALMQRSGWNVLLSNVVGRRRDDGLPKQPRSPVVVSVANQQVYEFRRAAVPGVADAPDAQAEDADALAASADYGDTAEAFLSVEEALDLADDPRCTVTVDDSRSGGTGAIPRNDARNDAFADAATEMRAYHRRGFTRNVNATLALIDRLRLRHGMNDSHFARLHHMGHPIHTFVTYCRGLRRGVFNSGSQNIQLAGKLFLADALRRAGWLWPDILAELESL